MKSAKINKIIKFSNVDGPGNRMAIFFQGCNLDCRYCHNPETIGICKECGECVKKCPTKALKMMDKNIHWDNTQCIECDNCIGICKNNSSPKTKNYSVEELINEVGKIKDFIQGVTVSGGESTLNSDFLTLFFNQIKTLFPTLTCFVDTNGYIDLADLSLKTFVKATDSFMLDIKSFSKEEHLELTGKNNETILKNAEYLLNLNKLFEVRTVIAPEILGSLITIKKVGNIIKKTNKKVRYKLIKYREFGVRKDKIKYFTTPTDKEMEKLKTELIELENADNIEIIII